MPVRRTLNEDDIKIGDILELTKERIGEVKFKGEIEGLGNVFGVEISPPALGKNDGNYKGTTYFSCPSKRGMFVKMDRIRRIIPATEITNVSTRLSKMGLSVNNENSSEDDMLYSLHNTEALEETPHEVLQWDEQRVKKWANEVLKGACDDQFKGINGQSLLRQTPQSLKALGFRPGQVRKLTGVMTANFGMNFGEN